MWYDFGMNEIEMKERLEKMVMQYGYTPEYQVEVAGLKIDVPVKYADASAFMVLFPARVDSVRRLIKTFGDPKPPGTMIV